MATSRLLFIHRSVGQNLIDDSGLYGLIRASGIPFVLHDYNQNSDHLQTGGGTARRVDWHFPEDDTTPGDYAALFTEGRLAADDTTLRHILAYDCIAIKSCFPNTRITSEAMLAAHQRAYDQIVRFFRNRPEKKLVIITSPPLVPTLTLPPFARRARRLADWLTTADFGPAVSVFDLFDDLAIPENTRQANTLRHEYRRPFPFDAHPNAIAAQVIAPKLLQCFIRAMRIA